MTKLVSFLLSVLALLGTAAPALAVADDAPGRFSLKVDRHVVHAGERFTATGSATVACGWTLEWNGDHRILAARAISGIAQRLTVTVPAHWTQTAVVTVLPPGSAVSPPETGGPGGALPNTGGPSWWLLLAGLGAVLAGSVVVRRVQVRSSG